MKKQTCNATPKKKRTAQERSQQVRKTGRTRTLLKSHGGRGCRQVTTEQACEAILKNRGNISAAARMLGLSRTALDDDYVKKIPEVMAAKQQSREIILDDTESVLDKRIQAADPWAVCFTLKTIGKDRGYIEKMEIGGKLEGLTIAVAGLPKDLLGDDL